MNLPLRIVGYSEIPNQKERKRKSTKRFWPGLWVWYRLRVLGSERHIPTQKFLKYLPWDLSLSNWEAPVRMSSSHFTANPAVWQWNISMWAEDCSRPMVSPIVALCCGPLMSSLKPNKMEMEILWPSLMVQYSNVMDGLHVKERLVQYREICAPGQGS